MLAQEDALHFSCKITKKVLVQKLFCLQIDDGINRSVTNNRYCLHIAWNVSPYIIGGIGTIIICTAKEMFHIICDDGLVLPITIFFSKEATEMSVPPTNTVYSNSDNCDSWWKVTTCNTGAG